jgi:hypothetical protein
VAETRRGPGGLPLVAGGALLEARTAAPGLRLDPASAARIERMERPDAPGDGWMMGRAEDFFSQVRSRLPGHPVVGFATNSFGASLELGGGGNSKFGGGRNPMCLPGGGDFGWRTGKMTDPDTGKPLALSIGYGAVSLPKCKFAGPSPKRAVGLCLGRCAARRGARVEQPPLVSGAAACGDGPAASYEDDAAWAAESCGDFGLPTTRTHRLGVCGEKESGAGASSRGGGDGVRAPTLRGRGGAARRLRAVCLFEGTGAEDPATGEAILSDSLFGGALPKAAWAGARDPRATTRLLGDALLDRQIALILPDVGGAAEVTLPAGADSVGEPVEPCRDDASAEGGDGAPSVDAVD